MVLTVINITQWTTHTEFEKHLKAVICTLYSLTHILQRTDSLGIDLSRRLEAEQATRSESAAIIQQGNCQQTERQTEVRMNLRDSGFHPRLFVCSSAVWWWCLRSSLCQCALTPADSGTCRCERGSPVGHYTHTHTHTDLRTAHTAVLHKQTEGPSLADGQTETQLDSHIHTRIYVRYI